MDVKRFFRVLRRHWLLMIGATVVAVAGAGAAYKKLSPTVWQSQSQLLLTQGNDPYGKAAQQVTPSDPGGSVSYMASLAPIYAAIANGDAVQARIHKIAPEATVLATDGADPISGANLPIVQLTVADPTAAGAHKVASQAGTILENYVANQQAASNVPTAQRVQFSAVQAGAQTKLLSGPSKTTGALLFVVIMACAIGLAFKLEKSGASREEEPSGRGWTTDADGVPTLTPDRVGSARRASSG